MKLKIEKDGTGIIRLSDVPVKTLVELRESMGNVPINAVGYKVWIDNKRFFIVIAGYELGVYYMIFDPWVQVVKSGTLALSLES